MANKFQKLLFNLSTMSPLALIFAIVYWMEKDIELILTDSNEFKINVVAVIIIAIITASCAFSFYSIVFVSLCYKKIERIPIGVDNIIPNDTWVVVVLLSYALPAAGVIFKDINLYISIAVILAWVIFLALSNSIIPNPLLMIWGYHFYKISTVDGSNDICLLSKRRGIHNRKSVNTVMIAFNYLAIEEKNADV
jgi:hypothetical protein